MWREHAACWSAVAAAVVIIGACVIWAVLVQTLVTPACDLTIQTLNAGYLQCPADEN